MGSPVHLVSAAEEKYLSQKTSLVFEQLQSAKIKTVTDKITSLQACMSTMDQDDAMYIAMAAKVVELRSSLLELC